MREESAPDVQVAILAARQYGLVTAAQLAAIGLDKSAVARRASGGRLHRVHRGVYAVGHPTLTFEGRCLAAVLALGLRHGRPGPAVSHRSAAALWGLLPAADGPVDVSLLDRGGRRPREGIALHRPTGLLSVDLTSWNRIPITRPRRTLRDLRRVVSTAAHRRAVRKALDLELIPRSDVLDESHLTRSELERLFLRLCRRFRLPSPEVNARLGRWEVDFLWRDACLAVETDGYRHHGSPLAFERDRIRDAELQGMGYRVLRFTYRQVNDSPATVADALRCFLPCRED